jgi:hypothetical protein
VITLDNSGKPLPAVVKAAAVAAAPAPAAAPAAANAPPAAAPAQTATNAPGASPFGFLDGSGVKSFFGLGGRPDAPQIKVFEPPQPIPTDAPLPPKRNAALDARGPQASAALLRTNAD